MTLTHFIAGPCCSCGLSTRVVFRASFGDITIPRLLIGVPGMYRGCWPVNQSTLRPTCVHLWDGYSSTRQRYRPSIICIPRRNSVHQAVSFRNVLSMTAIAGLCYNMFTFGVTVDNNRTTQPVRAIMLDVEGDVDYPAYRYAIFEQQEQLNASTGIAHGDFHVHLQSPCPTPAKCNWIVAHTHHATRAVDDRNFPSTSRVRTAAPLLDGIPLSTPPWQCKTSSLSGRCAILCKQLQNCRVVVLRTKRRRRKCHRPFTLPCCAVLSPWASIASPSFDVNGERMFMAVST